MRVLAFDLTVQKLNHPGSPFRHLGIVSRDEQRGVAFGADFLEEIEDFASGV